MTFLELCKKRFSVRKYSDKPVAKEDLVKILEAGRTAPSAHNFQPHRIYVLQSKEALDKIDAVTPCRYGAGTVLVFAYDKNQVWNNEHEEVVRCAGEQDETLFALQAMLQATEMGIGTTWVMDLKYNALKESLGLPENEEIVMIMPVGYAADDCEPSPAHPVRKPLEETVTYM